MEMLTQRVEFLAAGPGTTRSGELMIIVTIRPDPAPSFRPHNLALSRPQAIRLFKSLRTALRQSTGILLISLALASAAGCSAEVDLVSEKTVQGTSGHETATATDQQRAEIAVRLLDQHRPVPSSDQRPLEPGKKVEVTGDANVVIVVDGDLNVSEPHHDDQSSTPARLWNTKIPWPSQMRGVGGWTVGCYFAVVALVVVAVALMVGNLGRQQGGPLLTVVALLIGAAVLLQLLPHAESGLQVLPLPPWAYGGWLPVGISLLLWMAIAVAGYTAVSGCLDAPRVFAFFILVAMSLNGLLSFSQAAEAKSRPQAAASQRVEASFFGV